MKKTQMHGVYYFKRKKFKTETNVRKTFQSEEEEHGIKREIANYPLRW